MANDSWMTPPSIIESAREAMGSINTDPASNELAQQIVKADRYFTKEMSGLSGGWTGNVWLNPPYSRGNIEPFLDRLVYFYLWKHVEQAVILTNTVYTSQWWRRTTVSDYATAYCLPHERISFIDPVTMEPQKGNDRDQLITYVGRNPEKFCEAFFKHGSCSIVYRPKF